MNLSFEEYAPLLEKYAEYTVPADPLKRLADFYIIQLIRNWVTIINANPEYQAKSRLDDHIEENLKDIEKSMIPQLRDDILKAVFFSLASELPNLDGMRAFNEYYMSANNYSTNLHIYDTDKLIDSYLQIYDIHKSIFVSNLSRLEPFIDAFLEYPNRFEPDKRERRVDVYKKIGLENEKTSNLHRLAHLRYAMKKAHVSYREAVEYMVLMFSDKQSWDDDYGGEAWASIAMAWLDLYHAKGPEIAFRIDRINQLQHNTDTVFNKIEAYSKWGGYTWLSSILDVKFNATSVKNLIPYGSSQIQGIALKIEAAARRSGINITVSDTKLSVPYIKITLESGKVYDNLLSFNIPRDVDRVYIVSSDDAYKPNPVLLSLKGAMVTGKKLGIESIDLPNGLQDCPRINELQIHSSNIPNLKGVISPLQDLTLYRCPAIESIYGVIFDDNPDISCTDCGLKDFTGFPSRANIINVSRNPLKSLKGIPAEIGTLKVTDKFIDPSFITKHSSITKLFLNTSAIKNIQRRLSELVTTSYPIIKNEPGDIKYSRVSDKIEYSRTSSNFTDQKAPSQTIAGIFLNIAKSQYPVNSASELVSDAFDAMMDHQTPIRDKNFAPFKIPRDEKTMRHVEIIINQTLHDIAEREGLDENTFKTIKLIPYNIFIHAETRNTDSVFLTIQLQYYAVVDKINNFLVNSSRAKDPENPWVTITRAALS